MRQETIEQLNSLGHRNMPFICIVDFLAERVILHTLDTLPENLSFSFPTYSTENFKQLKSRELTHFAKEPLPFSDYKSSFDIVQKHLHRGDSYLANLTMKTPIETNFSLKDIYLQAKAPYRVLYDNRFTFFSPEIFVRIKGNQISTYPMKGTIDASLPQARERILEDKKESAEHATIVDLLRNDLSQIASKVHVPKYRYIDTIKTHEKSLLQVSSEVVGTLEESWNSSLGTLISKLLPAGSISGAPKPETLSIIAEAEEHSRDFYTGVTLFYDGKELDSCVNIRFIKQEKEKLFYHSGGGITHQSRAEEEYQEMVDKIYVPIS